MKRHAFLAAILALAAVAFVGIGAARTETPANPESSFDGRPVIVEKKGVYFGVSEDARFQTIGTNSFIVFKITPENGAAYDYWQPLSDISNIKVFGSVADAKAYAKKSSPSQERSGSGAKGND
jgi:hypothetical protein